MTTSVSSEDNLDWAGDTGAQSGGGADDALTTTASTDIWGFLKPYKNVFDKITKGTAGANEYAAAAGILGLLIPSLNKPQTAGWKGSIDLSKQYNRTPITQPAYKPYAQSASPVMGRQFFNSSYSAPPVADTTTGGAGADTTTGGSGSDTASSGAGKSIPRVNTASAGGTTNTPINTAPVYSHPDTLVAGSPGSQYAAFEGWDEYFTPTGAYRRFMGGTRTPITPMQFGSSGEGNLYSKSVSPYSVPYSTLGFTPDQPGYNARLAADKASTTKASGGIAALRRFDGGGNVDQPQRTGPQFYDYNVGANARMVDVPGIEYPVLMFFDLQNNRVVVSDEGYWNPKAPVGEDLSKAVAWARDQGLQAGVVVSPYSWDAFGKDAIGEDLESGSAHSRSMPGASFDQLKEYMNAADFVVTDPYVVSAQTATPGVQEKLIQVTSMIGDHAQETGKPAWLVLGGSEAPAGTDPNLIYNYTDQLLANAGNKFNQVSVFEGTRDLQPGAYLPTWDYLQASNILAKNGIQPTGNYGQAFENQTAVPATPYVGYDVGSIKVGSVQDFLQGVGVPTQEHFQPGVHIGNAPVNQPAALTGLAGSLPSGWSGYGAEQKIDWYNQNQVTPDQLLGAGVQQDELDWMGKQGYLGGQQPAAQPMSQPISQPMVQPKQTGIAQPMTQQMPQQTLPQPMPDQPRSPLPDFQLNEQEQVMAAQGGIMGYARGGKAMSPRYLRGETDGMQDRIPSNIDGVQPAKLSHGEFVIPADVVSHLGNGNSDAGAKVLYKMMDRVRQARTGNKKQGKQINPEKFTPGGIAGYAGGGAVAFQEGGTAPKTTPLGTSTETNISEWAGPYVGDMLSKTSALTNTPYKAYEGPLVAGTSPLQSKVFGGLEGLSFPGQLGQSFTAQGAYQLPSMTPGGVTGQATGPTGIASQYMNPYLNAVLTPQLDELRRQSQITQMGTAGKLAQAGAFGGSRQAIMDAETQRNLLAEQNKAIGTGYANAYDRAMGQFNVEQGQAKTLADMMAGAGTQQRGIEQEGITALQKQYETELLDPYTKLRFQKEMLQGLPVATTATTANTSTMDGIKGGLSDIQALMKALNLA
jgi:hypothetical protein